MGKKSKRVKTSSDPDNPHPPSPSHSPPQQHYTSDGPSEEEVNVLQTTSTSLQQKLDQLTQLASPDINDRAGFVAEFVPLDLTPADQASYQDELTNAPEAETQWTNLAAEISAIAAGKGVERIEGDQVTKAVFCFVHPLHKKCDREVAFVCVNGEWRAEG
jgi:hypothetical protein